MTTADLTESFVTVSQAAKVLGISKHSVYRSCRTYSDAVERGETPSSNEIPCKVMCDNVFRIPTKLFVQWWEGGTS